jgi:predicted transcriptional regulator
MEEKPKQKLCIRLICYHQLKEYLSVLIENNLLEYIDRTQTFKTTEKGLFFLKMHNAIEELLPSRMKNN